MAKGPAILPFDDFAPVNDPWPLKNFVNAAEEAGLRWLGASDPGINAQAAMNDGKLAELMDRKLEPLQVQIAIDKMLDQTFRSDVLCREDAPLEEGVAFEFALRTGTEPADPEASEIYRAIESFAPACVSCEQVAIKLTTRNNDAFFRKIIDGICCGWVRARIEPVEYPAEPPEHPKLDAFRLFCSRMGLPLVDAWHQPCLFPTAHYQVLAAMDGSLRLDELESFSRRVCPDLAFKPWIQHLAERGFFS
jgi:hypothetical protein